MQPQIDREQVRQQLATLGYKKGDRVFLRAFFPIQILEKMKTGRKAEATNLDQLIEHTYQISSRRAGRLFSGQRRGTQKRRCHQSARHILRTRQLRQSCSS
jgi:hypothetical protein